MSSSLNLASVPNPAPTGFNLPTQQQLNAATAYQTQTGVFAVPTQPSSPWASQPQMKLVQIPQAYRQTWGVYFPGAGPVFEVDSFVELKFHDKAKVSSFPTEAGGFASYNKVVEAYQPKVKLAVGGQSRMAAFMGTLYDELRTTNLYNIYTPEASYTNVTLESYSFSRTTKDGRNLLVAELTFMQVVQVTPQYTAVTLPSPKKPKDGNKELNGKTQIQDIPIEQKVNQLQAAHGAPPSYVQNADGTFRHTNVTYVNGQAVYS